MRIVILLLAGVAMALDYTCPNKPLCVSTLTTNGTQSMAPITVNNHENVMERVKDVMLSLSDIKLISCNGNECHFTHKSLLGFTDDINILWQPESGLLHFKSGARIGYYDFGVNRRRMKEFTKKFMKQDIDTMNGNDSGKEENY